MDNKPKHPGGRPPISEDQKKEMLSKLEGYLKSGLGIRKALGEAQIPTATFYRIMQSDDKFREQVYRFKNFIGVLASGIITRELMNISDKQNGNPAKKIKKEKLTNSDREFMKWFMLNSNLTKDEFSKREQVEVSDPEAEIQRIKTMIDETASEEIYHPDEPLELVRN